MSDPDLSIGSPEDRAHRDQIDRNELNAYREALEELQSAIITAVTPNELVILGSPLERAVQRIHDVLREYPKDE